MRSILGLPLEMIYFVECDLLGHFVCDVLLHVSSG